MISFTCLTSIGCMGSSRVELLSSTETLSSRTRDIAALSPRALAISRYPRAISARRLHGLLAESDGLIFVASEQALDHHEHRDPLEPVLVAERPGERLRLVEVFPHARPFAERQKRVSE